MHHPDLVNPLDDTRIDVKSGFTKDSRRVKSDDHEYEYDAVVLGAGPAGEAAAMKLTKSGKRVVVVDPRDQVGGNSTHVGTIPSKALRQSVFNLINFRRDPMFTKAMEYKQVPLNEVLAKARQVIRRQVGTHTRFYERNRIEVIQGWQVSLTHTRCVLKSMKMFMKPSLSIRPSSLLVVVLIALDLDFDHPRVFDSDKILQMDYVVKKIIIYGAGVIGCEYASIFTGLGYKVDLINNQNQLLNYLDSEISDAIAHDFRQFGVLIRQ